MRELLSVRNTGVPSGVGALLTLAALLAISPCPVAAQAGDADTPNVAQSQPVAANTQPDVQIVILPLPTGTYAVSSVYPKQVPKATAQARIDRLLALTKWTATSRKFSDAPAVPNPLRDDTTPKGNLSAASFETTGIIYADDGTINWDPFLRAFGDLRRINMVCFTGTDFVYAGPVSFDSERVTFSASSGQGTVAVVANLKKPELSPASFGLPNGAQTETVARQAPRRTKKSNGTNRAVYVVLIALGATAVALITYALTSRLMTKP